MNTGGVTSVVALYTFMTKLQAKPNYCCLNKFGKSHKPWFRYRCEAMADEVFGTGRSKGDAKRVVASLMLEQLSLRGYKVPQEFASPDAIWIHRQHVGLPTHSFVNLVKELCEQYRFGMVQYEVLVDSTRQPSFTVKARIGYVMRIATGSSKKIAQHLAAEQIYKYLHTWLMNTQPFYVEQVIRAQETAIAAVAQTSDQGTPNEQGGAFEQPGPSTSRRPSRRNRRQNKRRAAVQLAARQEVDQSEQGGSEVGPEGSPVAMNVLSHTMERLGI